MESSVKGGSAPVGKPDTGSSASRLSMAAAATSGDPVQAAEAAVAQLHDHYAECARADIEQLKGAVEAIAPQHADPAMIEKIRSIAHDMKGLGGSFGYPLLSEVAESLCRLTAGLEIVTPAQRALMSAHADSMALILQEGTPGFAPDRPRRLVQLLADLVKSERG